MNEKNPGMPKMFAAENMHKIKPSSPLQLCFPIKTSALLCLPKHQCVYSNSRCQKTSANNSPEWGENTAQLSVTLAILLNPNYLVAWLCVAKFLTASHRGR